MKKNLFSVLFLVVLFALAFLFSNSFKKFVLAYNGKNISAAEAKIEIEGSVIATSSVSSLTGNINSVSEMTSRNNLLINDNLAVDGLVEFTDENLQGQVNFSNLELTVEDFEENDKLGKGKAADLMTAAISNLGVKGNFSEKKSWLIRNSGSLPGRLYVNLQGLTNLENSCNDQEKAVDPQCNEIKKEGNLGKIIDLRIALDGKDKVSSTLETRQQAKIGKDWAALPAIILKPREEKILTAYWAVGENSYGNEIQSDSVEFVLNFQLVRENNKEGKLEISDSDDDGLSDYEEEQIYFTDPLKADTDADGYSDGNEVKNGYDPKDTAPIKKYF